VNSAYGLVVLFAILLFYKRFLAKCYPGFLEVVAYNFKLAVITILKF
jgi:hypothetical protein